MGRTASGYDPRIFQMHMTQALNEQLQEKRERMENNTQFSKNYWAQRANIATQILFDADPANGEAWYDQECNVPEKSTPREIYYLCYERVMQLTGSFPFVKSSVHRGVLIWVDKKGVMVFSKEIAKRQLYLNPFITVEEAQKWIDSLEWKHIGYGVILDLVPVSENAGA